MRRLLLHLSERLITTSETSAGPAVSERQYDALLSLVRGHQLLEPAVLCVRVCEHACVYVCVCVYVRVCVRTTPGWVGLGRRGGPLPTDSTRGRVVVLPARGLVCGRIPSLRQRGAGGYSFNGGGCSRGR